MPRFLATSPWSPLALVLLVLACTRPVADPIPPSETPAPTPAPQISERLAERATRLARLAERLETARVEHHVPGMAIAVVQDDEVILARGFGLADLQSGRPATEDTMFAIGSSTKAFTSTVVGMLVDEGKLAWDDPIDARVPELVLATKGGDRKPTLRDAMCHRTGFPRMSILWAGGGADLATIHAHASKALPTADLAKTFLYNNVVYASAGEAAARASGKRWSDLITERLLVPLQMDASNASYDLAVGDRRRAQGYDWDDARGVFEAVPMRRIDTVGAAGAINSTVVDMARWIRMQLGRGRIGDLRLVSKERIEDTWTPQIEVAPGLSYGLGWFVRDWKGHREVEHGGNIDGYSAEVALLPDDGIGFVLLTNVSGTVLQSAVRPMVWEALLGPLEPDAGEPTFVPDPMLGKYVADFGPFDDVRFTVTAKDGRLYLDVPGQTNYELSPPGADGKWKFAVAPEIAASFELDSTGKTTNVLRLHQGGLDYELPREGFVPPAEIDLSAYGEHLGRYATADGKLSGTVLVRNNRLAVDIPGQMAYELLPPDADGKWRFRVKRDIAIAFVPGKKTDEIAAFVLHQAGTETTFARAGKGPKIPTLAALDKLRKVERAEKKLAELGVVELRGKVIVEQAGVEGTLTVWFDGTRTRSETDFGVFGKSIEIDNGARAWSLQPGSPLDEHFGPYLQQAHLQHPAALVRDWRKTFETVEIAGQADHGGRPAWSVVLRREGLPPWRAVVAADSGDIVSLRSALMLGTGGSLPIESELSQHADAFGLRLPRVMTSSNPASGRTIVRIEEVRRSTEDPAKLFPDGP